MPVITPTKIKGYIFPKFFSAGLETSCFLLKGSRRFSQGHTPSAVRNERKYREAWGSSQEPAVWGSKRRARLQSNAGGGAGSGGARGGAAAWARRARAGPGRSMAKHVFLTGSPGTRARGAGTEGGSRPRGSCEGPRGDAGAARARPPAALQPAPACCVPGPGAVHGACNYTSPRSARVELYTPPLYTRVRACAEFRPAL